MINRSQATVGRNVGSGQVYFAGSRSGDEALEILERHVDLVFLDVKMPNLDGVMTLRQMVQKPGCPPVIIITAQAQADLEKRVRAWEQRHIWKPFDINITAACRGIDMKGESIMEFSLRADEFTGRPLRRQSG